MTDGADPPASHELLRPYTVVDLTQYLSGPFCTLILGALGARVIKVEPIGGDGNRAQPPFVTQSGLASRRASPQDIGLAFLKRNPGKQSIALNLKDDRGRELLYDLVRGADVLVHNYRSGVAERLGVDRESLMSVSPSLVYCAIEGLGAYGDSDDERGVVDIVGQALSGIMAVTGLPDGPPTRVGIPIADQVAGLFAAIAVMAGLLGRDGKSGSGAASSLSVSMLSALSSLVWDEHLDVYLRQGLPPRAGNGTPRIVPFDTFRAADGNWIAISGVSEREWTRLCSVIPTLGRSEAWDDLAARVDAREEIDTLIAQWVGARTTEDAMADLIAAGATAAQVRGPKEMLNDQHFIRSLLYEVEHPTWGRAGAYGARFPILVHGRQLGPYSSPAPLLNGDAENVIAEYSNLTAEELATLAEEGVIGGRGSGEFLPD